MVETEENHREYKTDEDFDRAFFKDIERKSNIWQCIQCGTCTASCESGRWTALKTRSILRKVVLGDLSVLEDPDIWLCTTCYQCYERCPRDVRPTDVIMELRNYATKRGNISPNHRAVVGYLKNFGHAVPINDEIRKRRVELGLDELPPTVFKYKQEGDDKDLKKFEEHLFDLPPIHGTINMNKKKRSDIKMDEKAIIEEIKKDIKKLNTIADAFIWFSGIEFKIDKNLFHNAFDKTLIRLDKWTSQLRDYSE